MLHLVSGYSEGIAILNTADRGGLLSNFLVRYWQLFSWFHFLFLDNFANYIFGLTNLCKILAYCLRWCSTSSNLDTFTKLVFVPPSCSTFFREWRRFVLCIFLLFIGLICTYLFLLLMMMSFWYMQLQSLISGKLTNWTFHGIQHTRFPS
jgi:hypothetical protein